MASSLENVDSRLRGNDRVGVRVVRVPRPCEGKIWRLKSTRMGQSPSYDDVHQRPSLFIGGFARPQNFRFFLNLSAQNSSLWREGKILSA